MVGVEAVCWSDYLCPWCYIGRSRSAAIEDLGVAVTHLPYELHPEIPPEGRRVRPNGRLANVFDRIEAECAELGLPFRRPARTPNTRRALETAEVVRIAHPAAFAALDTALFHAQFVEGVALDDPAVLDALVAEAGAPAHDVRSAVDEGQGRAAVDAAMDAAREAGVTSTPAWLIGDAFLIPGVQDLATVRRWVARLIARAPLAS
ncbi:MAG: hypothetical protein JWN46_777 [Acidimicrobiales bacterium]|nr:hypothetical protein [Acidimicrobiales bacterium]